MAALAREKSGATLAEYALATAFLGFAALVIVKFFPAAIRAYVAAIYYVVSSPLP